MHLRIGFVFAIVTGAVSAQDDGIVNGGFLEGLKGWTTEIRGGGNDKGVISGATGFASFREGASSQLSLYQTFRVPPDQPALSFIVSLIAFDRASRQAGDRIEVSLVDPATEKSVVPTWRIDSQAFLCVWEGGFGIGPGVRLLGARVLQDIRNLTGKRVRLRVDMIGGDDDKNSLLFVDDFRPAECASIDKPVLTKSPKGGVVRVAADSSEEFAIEFVAPATRTIRSLEVESSNLAGFTSTKPSLGQRASLVARWSPARSQVSPDPYLVRFTATTDCSPARTTSVTIRLFAWCPRPSLTKHPHNNVVRTHVEVPKEFEIEFATTRTGKITSLAIDSSSLPGLTWKEPKLGQRASVVARWTPRLSQSSPIPYPVRFTATDDCMLTASVTVNLFAYCGAPVLTKSPPGETVRVFATGSKQFEMEFAAAGQRKITALAVQSANLPGFTWTEPKLGARASLVARFAPTRSQISNDPYVVRFTAFDDCVPPEVTTITIDLYASCLEVTKAPPDRTVRVAANTSQDFEVEFTAMPGQEVTKLTVDSANLRGFTWTEPRLGRRASLTARWAPDHAQVRALPFPVRFTATTNCVPSRTVTLTVHLQAVEYGCGLLLGGHRANLNLGNGDFLLVQPVLTYVVTNQMPAFAIPNDRRLAGLRFFSQVFMGNQQNTKDPLMLSNGLEIVVGERASPYGSDRYMKLSTRAAPKLGGKLEFDVAIR